MNDESELSVLVSGKPYMYALSGHERDALAPDQRLRITEIFLSLQGEGRTVGEPTVFVRLTGCPLRCVYCDSEYAFYGGHWLSFAEIAEAVSSFDVKNVCVTGGEPLAQPNCIALLEELCEFGYQVTLETSGAMDISPVDKRVSRVLDIKTPDSGEHEKNLWSNIDDLTLHDQIKFVICARRDYDWAKETVAKYTLTEKCMVLFSPSHQQLEASTLADWIVQDKLAVRFQVQLHKYLWNDEPGR